jgi:hypothetical protein
MKYYLPTVEFHIYLDSQQSRRAGNFQQGKDPCLCMDNSLNRKKNVNKCFLALDCTVTLKIDHEIIHRLPYK